MSTVTRPRRKKPLPAPGEWTFELIETYHAEIDRVARSFGLDTYPIQIEVITSEQMMDAYSSVGMPVGLEVDGFRAGTPISSMGSSSPGPRGVP